ncbi:MAG: hypothetical protein ACT4OZ_12140 [Gemmatimonadota bacterium]
MFSLLLAVAFSAAAPASPATLTPHPVVLTAVDPVGDYAFEVDIGGQMVQGGIRVAKADTGYTAVLWAEGDPSGELTATSTRLDGNVFTFVVPSQMGSAQVRLTYAPDGSVAGEATFLDGPQAGGSAGLKVARIKRQP